MKLNKEELELYAALENDEFESIDNLQEEIDAIQSAAKAHFNKDKRINIRISSPDLEMIQKIAMEEGLPYQTLITSILHKYAMGVLKSNK